MFNNKCNNYGIIKYIHLTTSASYKETKESPLHSIFLYFVANIAMCMSVCSLHIHLIDNLLS